MCNMGNEVFLSAENILFTVSMIGYFITMILFFVFFAMKNEKAGSTAAYLLSACFGVHTVALVVRTIGAGRLPLTNNYEFATSFANISSRHSARSPCRSSFWSSGMPRCRARK